MSPLMFRVLAWALTGVFLVIFLQGVLAKRDQRIAAEAAAEQGKRTDAAVSAMVGDIKYLSEDEVRQAAGLDNNRRKHVRQYQEELRNDPIARAWADTPVPDRLREQARERRLARERLGCAGDGCGDDGAVAPSSR